MRSVCFLSLSLQVLLYHNYNYTAPENLGRDVLLGQVSPLFHTAREQCPGGRGIECRVWREAAEDNKEGERKQTLVLGLGLLVERKKNTRQEIKIFDSAKGFLTPKLDWPSY